MSDFTIGAFRGAHRPTLRSILAGAGLTLQSMLRARKTRRLLLEMDDHLLSDIGVGRGDALAEADRPMWDLKPSRR